MQEGKHEDRCDHTVSMAGTKSEKKRKKRISSHEQDANLISKSTFHALNMYL